MSVDRYLEDFSVGQTFRSGAVTVEPDQIKKFASQFDPQPFHLDEAAASASFFGGLVASGWHTACLTMRMIVESEIRVAGGLIGMGADELKWPRPVRPGDTLHTVSEVLEVRPSKSKPELGIVKMRTETINQDGESVLILVTNLIVPRRPAWIGTPG
jgi:acyl dehydratase